MLDVRRLRGRHRPSKVEQRADGHGCSGDIGEKEGWHENGGAPHIHHRPEANVLNAISKKHWGIESYHWSLDTCQKQDGIKRKTAKAARNLDTIQRMCLSIISIWRRKRKKIKDRLKGYTEIVTKCSDNLNFLFDVMALK